METFVDSFGTIIKTIRKERNMTQKMLSQGICSQSVLSRIENNEELPNVLVMAQICQRLGVTIDHVMTLSHGDIRKNLQQLDLLDFYFQRRDYRKLAQLLKNDEVKSNLYSDADYQRYYYYLGVCEFYLAKNISQAVCYLKEALTYSSHSDRVYVSDTEVQLISAIGKIYGVAGRPTEARYYLSKSIQLFQQSIETRVKSELSQIFYNYGTFLFQQGEIDAALEHVNRGIRWTQEKNSYYFLNDLFALKSLIYKKKNEPQKAAFYEELAQAVRKISKNS
ncbi:helix-turn-helix domain-containing protein [Enterococcus sp. DIV0660C]|uniref:helix-turn-helix domain-containing protein n=1 Tax=Enterococcus sp. DIV0660C TaxID=2230880 RepID=UPI001A8F2199|nr:helix-turn-helix domain-containing protein [Enterococcus sp. DIV0660C]MBO0431642.1 helix-turn-helix transcriptional regulator [Enterococcus sp. DIV0660C]